MKKTSLTVDSYLINSKLFQNNPGLDSGVNILNMYTQLGVNPILVDIKNDTVGLQPIKRRLQEIAAFFVIQKIREQNLLSVNKTGLHMSFTGNPGTGKSLIASQMANILYKLGATRTNNLLTVTRDDLVGQYIGHTAPKTKAVLEKALGGVLFIDEAYYLYKPDNERDYGSESIEILLQVMENQRDDLVVIFAGYKEPMKKFYQSNPGLASRISNHINFENYSSKELIQIFKFLLKREQYSITDSLSSYLIYFINNLKRTKTFANARSLKNVIYQAQIKQARRILRESKEEKFNVLSKRELTQLTYPDFFTQDTYINSPIIFKIPEKVSVLKDNIREEVHEKLLLLKKVPILVGNIREEANKKLLAIQKFLEDLKTKRGLS